MLIKVLRPFRRLMERRGWLRLQAVREVNGFARMRCGGENRPLVVFQDLRPVMNVAGVVLAHFRGDLQISTEKRGAKLGDQFLERVAFVTPAFAAEVSVKP
jgi:hypothetical protein